MFDLLLRPFSSPYLLIVVALIGCLIGGVVVGTAVKRGSNSSGIDAARIHQMRFAKVPE
ncbi:MAG: hypothetical protein Q8K75_06275 [Chlamydiales bacterium]|nr:hypothetical protein [Chlamydiales bacterium]